MLHRHPSPLFLYRMHRVWGPSVKETFKGIVSSHAPVWRWAGRLGAQLPTSGVRRAAWTRRCKAVAGAGSADHGSGGALENALSQIGTKLWKFVRAACLGKKDGRILGTEEND